MHEITELLQAWGKGDEQALEKLVPMVDPELKKIAHGYMVRERPGNILQTTALVNEALIKLIKEEDISWENRKQFYGFVARRMRQVLIDYAQHNPNVEYKNVDDANLSKEKSKEILMLEAALTKLASLDERKATIVECRFFIGLTIPEVAELLGVGEATVERDWRFARDWLKTQMTGEPGNK